LTGIAEIKGTLGCAHRQVFCGCRRLLLFCYSRLVFAGAPGEFPDRSEIIERAAISIRSERKWPEKVVLDTSKPTMTPPFDIGRQERKRAGTALSSIKVTRLECYAAQAGCVFMVLRMTCARWQELEDEQILALHGQLRSNRLNGS
jgi:hypothetical protein